MVAIYCMNPVEEYHTYCLSELFYFISRMYDTGHRDLACDHFYLFLLIISIFFKYLLLDIF